MTWSYIYIGQWPIFHGPVLLCCILKTIWWANDITEILDLCDTKICLINICRSVTYISWSCGFVLYLEDISMDKCHNWDIGSKDLPHKMYVGQWPIFHGPVILSYILKTIWWLNVLLKKLIQCDTNFDLQIYVYISDLYFVVQWSWILFYEQPSFFGNWFSVIWAIDLYFMI